MRRRFASHPQVSALLAALLLVTTTQTESPEAQAGKILRMAGVRGGIGRLFLR